MQLFKIIALTANGSLLCVENYIPKEKDIETLEHWKTNGMSNCTYSLQPMTKLEYFHYDPTPASRSVY